MDTTRTTLSLFDEASTRKKVVLAVAFAALCISQGLTDGPFVGVDDFVEVEIAGSQMDVPGTGNCVDLDDFGTAACAISRVKAMTEFVSTQSEDLLTGEEPEEDAADDSEASLDILFAGLETGEPLIANVSGDGFTKPRTQQAGSALPWSNSGGGSRMAALGSGLPSFSGASGGYGGNGGAPSSAPATDPVTDNDVVDEIDAPVAQRRVADTTPSKDEGDDLVAVTSDDGETKKEDEPDGGGGPTFEPANPGPQEDDPSEDCDTETETEGCETDPSDGEPGDTGTDDDVADTDGPQDEGTGNDDTGNDDDSDNGGPDNSGPVGDPFEDDLVVVDPEDPTGEPPGYLPPTGPPFFPPVVPDEPNDDAGNGTAADVPVPSTLALFLLAAFGLRLRKRA